MNTNTRTIRWYPTLSFVTAVALSIVVPGGCIIPASEDVVKEYPIAPGRYYKAAELDSVSRDSALFFTDFSASGNRYFDVLLDRPGCPTFLLEGPWYAFTSQQRPEKQLHKRTRNASGSSWNTECLPVDSLNRVSRGSSHAVALRNVTDTSFETCNDVYPLCYGLCSPDKINLYSGNCTELNGSGPNDSDWTIWIK